MVPWSLPSCLLLFVLFFHLLFSFLVLLSPVHLGWGPAPTPPSIPPLLLFIMGYTVTSEMVYKLELNMGSFIGVHKTFNGLISMDSILEASRLTALHGSLTCASVPFFYISTLFAAQFFSLCSSYCISLCWSCTSTAWWLFLCIVSMKTWYKNNSKQKNGIYQIDQIDYPAQRVHTKVSWPCFELFLKSAAYSHNAFITWIRKGRQRLVCL